MGSLESEMGRRICKRVLMPKMDRQCNMEPEIGERICEKGGQCVLEPETGRTLECALSIEQGRLSEFSCCSSSEGTQSAHERHLNGSKVCMVSVWEELSMCDQTNV